MITITFEEYGELTEEEYDAIFDFISQFGGEIRVEEKNEK